MGNSNCGCGPRRNQRVLYNIQNRDWANAVNNLSLTGVKMLHQQDPDLINEIVTNNGYIAIHIAVQRRHYDLFLYLLKYGANINALCGDNGNSCLHLAVINKDIKTIQELFNCDCDDTIVNKNGETPTDLIQDLRFRRQYMRAKNKHRFNINNTFSEEQSIEIENHYVPLINTLDSITETTIDGYMDDIDCDSDDDKHKYQLQDKHREIAKRDPNIHLTEFGKRVGCEVDEIAHCVQRLHRQNKLLTIWDKWIQKNKILKSNDLLKLLYGLTVVTLKKKGDKHGYYTENNGRPPPEPIKALANMIYKKLPEYKPSNNTSDVKKKRVLRRKEFAKKFCMYLYDAHEEFVTKYNEKYNS